jgi:hypothetical protein
MAVTRARLAFALLGAALALAGCSGGTPSEAVGSQPQFAGLDRAMAGMVGGAAGRAQPRLVIVGDPAAAPAPLLSVEIPARGASARLAPSGRNGAVVTWRSVDAVSLSLRAPGVLVGTRGLGEDLIVADARATADALMRAAPGPVARRHRRLDGEMRLGTESYDCTLTLAGRERIEHNGRPRDTWRFEERCTPAAATASGSAAPGGFTNLYWRDATRPVLWQSLQWIGPELGQLRIRHPGE